MVGFVRNNELFLLNLIYKDELAFFLLVFNYEFN